MYCTMSVGLRKQLIESRETSRQETVFFHQVPNTSKADVTNKSYTGDENYFTDKFRKSTQVRHL